MFKTMIYTSAHDSATNSERSWRHSSLSYAQEDDAPGAKEIKSQGGFLCWEGSARV